MSVASALLLLAAGQGLFLAVLLLVRRPRAPGSAALAAMVAALALSNIDDVLLETGAYSGAPWAAGWSLLLLPWYGVLLRAHFAALLEPPGRRALPRRLFVAPTLAALAALGFLAYPPAARLALLRDDPGPPDPAMIAATLAVLAVAVQSAASLGLALLACWRAAQQAEPADAAAASRLPWLRGLLAIVLAAWAAYVLSLAAGFAGVGKAAEDWSALVYLLALYALGGLALVRPGTILPAPAAVAGAVLRPQPKYARSALDAGDVARIGAKLDAAMARGLWRDPALSLPRLAAAVGAPPNDVSQAINTAHGASFYDYVNRFRIEAAKAALADPARTETILDLALEAGFNSKSVFNAAFKRATGLTPSAFRAAGGSEPARTDDPDASAAP